MATKEAVINLLKEADALCFDVDSTVCVSEGIDDLASYCGRGEQVKEMYAILFYEKWLKNYICGTYSILLRTGHAKQCLEVWISEKPLN